MKKLKADALKADALKADALKADALKAEKAPGAPDALRAELDAAVKRLTAAVVAKREAERAHTAEVAMARAAVRRAQLAVHSLPQNA